MTAPAGLVSVPYPLAYLHLGLGHIDLQAADVRLMLATGAYTPAATDEWAAAVTPYEAAGTGYSAGGVSLPNHAFAYDANVGRAVLTCDPVVFARPTFIARHAVVYAAVAAGNALLAHADFGADIDPAGTDITLSFPAGVLRLGPTTTA